MNHPVYVESQFSSVIWVVLPVVSISVFLHRFNLRDPAQRDAAIAIIALMNVVALALLGKLTISIDATHLRWRFGFVGWPAWSVALADISAAEETRSRWLEGWGIKYTKQGMLYNAYGTAAVRIHRVNGKSFRLGCSDPKRLLSFLTPRITLPAGR
ncbi:hypothetical protein ACO0LO_24075 [Undibacterium sp. TJN25]|uniref:hypothetical protein n=1 Tax=Undibacterium sp. TJN25 TaxID=3413056 RepID=UPI003BF446BE